jgi:hypothetical protein
MALGLTQPLKEIRTIKSFWGVKSGQYIRMTTLPLSVSRLSGQCRILKISQPYRPPRPVTAIALLYGDGVLPVRYKLDYKYCYK